MIVTSRLHADILQITAKYKYSHCIFLGVKVGLMFDDKRLEYRVMHALEDRGIDFTLLNDTINFSGVILSDFSREHGAILIKDAITGVRRVTSYIHGKKRFSRVVVGIDPGPKPGIAVVGDGIVVEEVHLNNVSKTREEVDSIYEGYYPRRFLVRIGDGDIVNRNRIVNSLIGDYEIELVDERNTTTSITNRDVVSAKNIAFSHGKIIRRRINTVVKEGYLREIQRRSRIESGGLVTIPRELAKKVALGEITLQSAIRITRESR